MSDTRCNGTLEDRLENPKISKTEAECTVFYRSYLKFAYPKNIQNIPESILVFLDRILDIFGFWIRFSEVLDIFGYVLDILDTF